MGYLGAQGKQIHEKKLNMKISCQTPFKQFNSVQNKYLLLGGFKEIYVHQVRKSRKVYRWIGL